MKTLRMFLSVRFLIENALNNNFVPYKFEQISRYFRKSCKNLERKGFNSPLKRQQLLEHYPFLTITSCSDTRVIQTYAILRKRSLSLVMVLKLSNHYYFSCKRTNIFV